MRSDLTASRLDTFQLAAYFDYLEAVKSQRPVVPATAERPSNGAWLALQHDVDLNLSWAADVAREESDRGFHSCYYVQVGCPFYDVTSAEARLILHDLRAMGHEVGLHYDWRRYEKMAISIDEGLERDLQLLSIIAGHRVQVVCAHMPLRNGTPKHGAFATPQVAGEVYVSDSARGFRDSAIRILTDPPEKLRFNMHACWWQKGPRGGILHRAYNQAAVKLQDEFAEWQDVDVHPNALEQDVRRRAA